MPKSSASFIIVNFMMRRPWACSRSGVFTLALFPGAPNFPYPEVHDSFWPGFAAAAPWAPFRGSATRGTHVCTILSVNTTVASLRCSIVCSVLSCFFRVRTSFHKTLTSSITLANVPSSMFASR